MGAATIFPSAILKVGHGYPLAKRHFVPGLRKLQSKRNLE